MKKITMILIMALLLTFSFAACANDAVETSKPTESPEATATPNPELTESLEDIIKKMHEAVPEEISGKLEFTEINSENVAYFLGTDEVSYTQALAAEPLISVIPHSIVVLRVEEGTDVDATVELIKANADPRKWICVGVEDDQVLVSNIGNTIALVIDENAQEIMQIFDDLENK